MSTLWQDVRYALRTLRKSPGFALVAVLTVGLAIGANTTVFTWMERLVLHPLPVIPEADRLALLGSARRGGAPSQITYAMFQAWREGARTFDGVAAQAPVQLSLRAAGPVQRAWGVFASWNLFRTLRVRPAIGRDFLPDEEARGAPVAVISHALWLRAFAGDSAVVGRQAALNGRDFTIVGVLPRRFLGTDVGLSYDVWVPLTLRETLRPERDVLANPGHHWLWGVGRLKPGVGLDQARRDLDGVQRGLEDAGLAVAGVTVAVRPLGATAQGSAIRTVTTVLLGITVLVLLVACANLANMLLARAAMRSREMGVRLAVGAGRWRLVRQLLTESAAIALAGGGLGVLIALWASDALRGFVPPSPVPIGLEMYLDWRVLGTAGLVTLGTVLAFGLVPALRATGVDVTRSLRAEPGAPSRRGSRLQSVFVCTQIALSLVSLVCAGLFLRALQSVRAVDVGLREPELVLLVSTNLFRAGVSDSAGPAVVDRLLGEVAAVPGVRSASAANWVPLGPGGGSSVFVWVGGSADSSGMALVHYNGVAPDYLATMGIALLRGRGITADDRGGREPVAIVNEAFAARHWPGRDPLGRRIRFPDRRWHTVVGVARNVRLALGEAPEPAVYTALAQDYAPDLVLHVRATADPRSLVPALRRAFQRVHPGLPFVDVRTLAEEMGFATLLQKVASWMLASFGALALALATVGLYGVMAFSVAGRTREIGVRVALGADRMAIARMVLVGALRLVVVGMGIGGILALGAGRLVRSQILGVSPTDPVTFLGAGLLLTGVAGLAAWLPARRAAAVDPVVALRAE